MNYFEGRDSIESPDMIFPAIEEMRTPIQYLANLLTAGDTTTVKDALQKMAMMRSYMRAQSLPRPRRLQHGLQRLRTGKPAGQNRQGT
ncbi:hypothetical protein BGX30_009406, partial [Mortierella sp. GBA39]